MEQEISLRELIEVLLRWKWLIVIITITAVLVSGVLSFFVLAPTYEATATLGVNLPELDILGAGRKDVSAVVDAMVRHWRTPMESYKVTIRDAVTLTDVINQLQLDPEEFGVETLQQAIRVDNPRETNLLHVSVRTGDRRLSKDLANTIAEQFVVRIHKEHQMLIATAAAALKSQVDEEEQRFKAALESYRQLRNQPEGVAEVEQEISAKTRVLTDLEVGLVAQQGELAGNRKGLAAAQAHLLETPVKLVTSKSLVNDQFLQELVRQRLGANVQEIALLSMTNEEINPIYIAVQQQVNEFRVRIAQLTTEEGVVRRSIATTQEELRRLRVELASKQAEQDRLLANIDRLRAGVAQVSLRYMEARRAASLESGGARVRIISPALAPLQPIAPRRMLNMAVAAVLGLMVSVFLAFFLEYWRGSAVSPSAGHGEVRSQ